jgi:hypothetical protein
MNSIFNWIGLGVLAGPNLIEVNQAFVAFAVIDSFGMGTVRVLYTSLFQAFKWGRRGRQPSQLKLNFATRPRLSLRLFQSQTPIQ